MNTAHEVLVAGRNYLERYGWFVGGAGPPGYGSPRCAGAAPVEVMVRESGSRSQLYDLRNDVLSELAAAMGLSSISLIGLWNDRPGRTKEEVLAAYDKAIAATAPAPAVPELQAPEEVPV